MSRISKTILFICLFFPLLLFANNKKYKLAQELTEKVYPSDFYSLYGPLLLFQKPFYKMTNIFVLNKTKNKDLKQVIKTTVIRKGMAIATECRAEIFTEEELKHLLQFYQTKIGISIIEKEHIALKCACYSQKHNENFVFALMTLKNQGFMKSYINSFLTPKELKYQEAFDNSSHGKIIQSKMMCIPKESNAY